MRINIHNYISLIMKTNGTYGLKTFVIVTPNVLALKSFFIVYL
jgi:hypothetical protein